MKVRFAGPMQDLRLGCWNRRVRRCHPAFRLRAGHLIRRCFVARRFPLLGPAGAGFRFEETSRRGLSSSMSCVLLNHQQSLKGNLSCCNQQ